MFICFDGLQVAVEVIDLPLGTALALSAVPDPDNETIEQQHIRIGSALAMYSLKSQSGIVSSDSSLYQ